MIIRKELAIVAVTVTVFFLPAFAGFEAEREEEGGEFGEGLGRGDRVDECNAFDHDFG